MSEQQQPQFSIEKIYLKDLSLEIPNAPQIFLERESPQIEISVHNGAVALDQAGLFEVVLTVTVTAKLKEKTVFLVEVGAGRDFPDTQPAAGGTRCGARRVVPEHPAALCARSRGQPDDPRRFSAGAAAAHEFRCGLPGTHASDCSRNRRPRPALVELKRIMAPRCCRSCAGALALRRRRGRRRRIPLRGRSRRWCSTTRRPSKARKLYIVNRGYPLEVVVQVEGWTKVRDAAGALAWAEAKCLDTARTVLVRRSRGHAAAEARGRRAGRWLEVAARRAAGGGRRRRRRLDPGQASRWRRGLCARRRRLGRLSARRHRIMNIAVLGAGAWGTALGINLAARTRRHAVGARSAAGRRPCAQPRNERYLPGYALPGRTAG